MSSQTLYADYARYAGHHGMNVEMALAASGMAVLGWLRAEEARQERERLAAATSAAGAERRTGRMNLRDTTSRADDDGEVLGEIACRSDRLPSWAEDAESDPYTAMVGVVDETDRDGDRWVYLHAQEREASVRVDLDTAGWRRLRDLCDAAIRASEGDEAK